MKIYDSLGEVRQDLRRMSAALDGVLGEARELARLQSKALASGEVRAVHASAAQSSAHFFRSLDRLCRQYENIQCQLANDFSEDEGVDDMATRVDRVLAFADKERARAKRSMVIAADKLAPRTLRQAAAKVEARLAKTLKGRYSRVATTFMSYATDAGVATTAFVAFEHLRDSNGLVNESYAVALSSLGRKLYVQAVVNADLDPLESLGQVVTADALDASVDALVEDDGLVSAKLRRLLGVGRRDLSRVIAKLGGS
jgi:hypothetical protein